jgi:hypothetical protein
VKNQPEAPEAPDYAAANEAGVQADINALPLRNAINAATTLGTSYTDPNTGKVYDFTGLGSQDIANQQLKQQLADAPEIAKTLLGIQQEYGDDFAQVARDNLAVTDPTGFAMRNEFGDSLRDGSNSNQSLAKDLQAPQYEMYGAGDPGSAGTANYEAYVRNNPDLLANWESNEKNNPGQTLASYGQQHYEASGKGEGREVPMDGYRAPRAANNGPEQARLGNGPTLATLDAAGPMERLGGQTSLADRGATAAGRSALEQSIFDEVSRIGQSDPSLDRAAQQAARARGAASGNLMGDGSAMNESLAVQAAQRAMDAQRRAGAQDFLASGQSTSDTNNRMQQEQLAADMARTGFNNNATQADFTNKGLQTQFNNSAAQQGFQNQAATIDQNNMAGNQAFQNAMTSIGQRNQALQNSFGSQQAAAQQQIAAHQQDIANKQSYLGLTPIVAQGSMLSGLQQGAAPTTSGTGYGAVGTAQNAGALGSAFAGNVFGTQANIFGTQSQAATAANGQMMSAASGLAGGFMCHVARQVYGDQNGRWVVFYYWKELMAPKWFRAVYNRAAPQVAALIRPFPAIQSGIRLWMDSKIQIA